MIVSFRKAQITISDHYQAHKVFRSIYNVGIMDQINNLTLISTYKIGFRKLHLHIIV